ncbi:MAG: MFS transporter [Prevotellaceae bacterium]|jgi:MFS family permease|nr:MFS transporter [Prevotellaceae bacterium]
MASGLLQQLKEKDAKAWYRVSVCAFYFVQGLIFASWASRIPDLKQSLSMNDAQLGSVLLIIPIGEFVTMALSGYLVSKYGSRRMLLLSAQVYSLILVSIGLVATYAQLYVALFLFGMVGNLSNISINTQAVGVERLFQRSIMGVFHGLWSCAGFVGALTGALMVALNLSPLVHFLIVYTWILCIVVAMQRSILPRDARQKRIDEAPRKIFTRPDAYVLIIGLLAFANMVCEGTVFDWSGIYFKDVIAPPENLVRLGYIAAMSSMTVGRFTVDRFIMRFGVIRVLRTGGSLIVAGLLLTVVSPHLITSTLGFLLIGAGISPAIPICFSLVGRSKAMLPSIALATVSSISFFGLLMGPPLIGFVSEAIGLRWALCIIGLFGLLVVSLTPFLKKYNV